MTEPVEWLPDVDDAWRLDPRQAPLATKLRLLGRTLREDVVAAARYLVVDILAGSAFTPRVVRYGLLRAIGNDVRTANISPKCSFGPQISIGQGTFVGAACLFEGPVSIGQECQIAREVMVLTTAHPLTADGEFAHLPDRRPVVIGDRVWLGARTIVLPGVRIGDNVVVGAGSVVTRDCLAPGVYAGSPARLVREWSREPSGRGPA
jgi:acetyltransferase-like isoleucine patch superfamily enzyme